MKTRTRINKIKQKIRDLQAELEQIRASCPHPGLTGTYRADTGNYDSSADTYYIVYRCPECDAHWQEYQNEIRRDTETGEWLTRDGFKFTPNN